MTEALKSVDYSKFSDDELIGLLFTEEDRLPREAVDEFIRRGDRLADDLIEIISDGASWREEPPEWWAVVHCVYFLGSIGTEKTIIPLLKALRFADMYDCDWVLEELPSIFGKLGQVAVEPLKNMAKDRTTDWYPRITAASGLAAMTIYNPELERDVFTFLFSIFNDEGDDYDTRSSIGNILLDFQRTEYKKELTAFGKEAREESKDIFMGVAFDDEDVARAFRESKDLWHYTRDWLSFYDNEEIRKRQERWEREKMEREEDNEEEESEPLYVGHEPYIRDLPKIGRNDPCPCGSGKKYKKCCMEKENFIH